jgi:hypothetical protein
MNRKSKNRKLHMLLLPRAPSRPSAYGVLCDSRVQTRIVCRAMSIIMVLNRERISQIHQLVVTGKNRIKLLI